MHADAIREDPMRLEYVVYRQESPVSEPELVCHVSGDHPDDACRRADRWIQRHALSGMPHYMLYLASSEERSSRPVVFRCRAYWPGARWMSL
jgi:hypothetical protein